MAAGGQQRGTREERERARIYQARRAYHEGRSRRRTRDNIVAGVAGGLLILAVIAGQAAYFLAGPGAPVPSPTPTPGSTVVPEPTDSPTEAPTPTSSPEPTETPAS